MIVNGDLQGCRDGSVIRRVIRNKGCNMDDNNNKGLSKEEILRRKLQYELERMYYNIEVASESNGATKDVHNPRHWTDEGDNNE